jgi:hypothetical protein
MKSYKEIAVEFGSALKERDFSLAHSLLCQSQKEQLSETSLQEEFERMFAHDEGAINIVEVTETLEEWPAKEPDDLGWAYVAISGETFAEAVTLVIKNENGQPRVGSIEWGRP